MDYDFLYSLLYNVRYHRDFFRSGQFLLYINEDIYCTNSPSPIL